jgi:hypothetical protein
LGFGKVAPRKESVNPEPTDARRSTLDAGHNAVGSSVARHASRFAPAAATVD